MLVTNQRLDKLAVARVNFQAHGMLSALLFSNRLEPAPPPLSEDNDNNDGGAIDGKILGEVILAKRASSFFIFVLLILT